MEKTRLSRREFVRLSGLAGAGAILAACAPKVTPAPAQPTAAPQAEAPTAAPEQPTPVPQAEGPQEVTITMWFHDFLYVQFFTDRGKEWAEMHPEYQITWDIAQVPEIADKYIGTLVAGSGAPDIVGVEQGWMPRLFKGGLAEKGMYDLNPWMELEGAGFRDKFLRWELYSYQGKTYGVESALCPCVYYYRKDIFDQAGLDPTSVKTYDDFIQMGKDLKSATGSYMLPLDSINTDYFLLFMLQNDGNLFDDKGQAVMDSDQCLEALQLYYDMGLTHEIGFVTTEFWGAGLTAAYNDGTVAGVIGPDWYSDFVMKQSLKDTAGKWRATYMPLFREGGRRTTVWGGTGMGVSKQSKFPDVSWDILKYTYMTKENQVKRYLEIHYFPTMLDALDDPRIVEAEDEFFGGQKLGAIFADVAPDVPIYYSGPYKTEAIDLLSNAVVTPVMAKEKPPEDALKDATSQLKDIIAQGM